MAVNTSSDSTVITPLFHPRCVTSDTGWGSLLPPPRLWQGLTVVFPFRIGKVGNQKRVVGVLLGSWQKKILDVSNSFAGEFGCPALLQSH